MILDQLRHPIVLAPLAGGPSTPALAAAVSEAGGFGFLAAGYLSADALRDQLRELRARTARPFGVNLFVPGRPAVDEAAVRRFVERLRPEAERYGVQPGEARFEDDGWQDKLAILHEQPPPVVSFTFGCPAFEAVDGLRRRGSEVWITVTDVAEARAARDRALMCSYCRGSRLGVTGPPGKTATETRSSAC